MQWRFGFTPPTCSHWSNRIDRFFSLSFNLTVPPTHVGEQCEHVKKAQRMLDKQKKETHVSIVRFLSRSITFRHASYFAIFLLSPRPSICCPSAVWTMHTDTVVAFFVSASENSLWRRNKRWDIDHRRSNTRTERCFHLLRKTIGRDWNSDRSSIDLEQRRFGHR